MLANTGPSGVPIETPSAWPYMLLLKLNFSSPVAKRISSKNKLS